MLVLGNKPLYFNPQDVYYGSSDDKGLISVSMVEQFYNSLPQERRQFKFFTIIGGLYTLNWLTFMRPAEIVFYDINRFSTAHAQIVVRLWKECKDADTFLNRLKHGDVETLTKDENTVKRHFSEKTVRVRGELEKDWRIALENYDQIKEVFLSVPCSFTTMNVVKNIFRGPNVWAYFSNLFQIINPLFHIDDAENVIFSYSLLPPTQGRMVVLDLHGCGTVDLKCSDNTKVIRGGEEITVKSGVTKVIDMFGATCRGGD